MIQQVTLLLERGDLGPEASAAILQRLLPPEALYSMQLASRADPLLVPAPRLSADRISACPPAGPRSSGGPGHLAAPVQLSAPARLAVPAGLSARPTPQHASADCLLSLHSHIQSPSHRMSRSAAGRLFALPHGYASVVAWSARSSLDSDRSSMDFTSWRSSGNSAGAAEAGLDARCC